VHLGPPLPANALGTAQWLPDHASSNCMRCGEEFSWNLRRHHCRQCGELFCHRCCNSKALLQPDSGTRPEDRVVAHPVWGSGEVDDKKPQKVCEARSSGRLGGATAGHHGIDDLHRRALGRPLHSREEAQRRR